MGIPDATARVGVITFWILCLIAAAGMFTTAARSTPLWVWAVPVLLWLSVALVNAETPRFREPVDPFLILSAACAIAAAPRVLQALVPLQESFALAGERKPSAARTQARSCSSATASAEDAAGRRFAAARRARR